MDPSFPTADLPDPRTAQSLHTPPSPAAGFVAEEDSGRLGPYELIRILGEGGFGVIYLAQQHEPVKRRVALKLIKPGMDSRAVIARFQAERQALALMNHPNVARVYDAGATPLGRPYFVMEHVAGVPITEYCDAGRLTTRERLRLFIGVCLGVQHAHQKGIIHRDVKPGNVLITVEDGRPVPKVIDFGVAKALDERLGHRTLFTEVGQLVGTPEFMSPEQAGLDPDDIDTRTDIYSLGVVLYLLLSGQLPFDSEELRRQPSTEVQRIIREADPPRPSTRVASLRESARPIAAQRGTEPAALTSSLRRDLDWITLKAMEKDRTRRYQTVSELVADIERYLADEPVSARPPSAAYKLAKFARRNRAGVAAGLIIVLGLFAGFVVAAVAVVEMYTARAETASERDDATNLRKLAEAKAAAAREVSGFLNDMLSSVDPAKRGKDVMVRDLLDEASQSVALRFKDRPRVEADIRDTLSRSYKSLGLYDLAAGHARRALEIRRSLPNETDPQIADTLNTLGLILIDDGKPDEAEPILREAVQTCTRALGPEAPSTLNAEDSLGQVLHTTGRVAEAEALFRHAATGLRKQLGPDDPAALDAAANLGSNLRAQRKLDEAEPLLQEVYQSRLRVSGERDPKTLTVMSALGVLYSDTGRLDRAEPLYRRYADLAAEVFGPEHPDALLAATNLAGLLRDMDRLDESVALYRRMAEAQVRVLGEGHPDTIYTLNSLGRALRDQKKDAEAEPIHRRALAAATGALGPDHPDTLESQRDLGLTLVALGRAAEAEPIFADAAAKMDKTFPPGFWRRGLYLNAYGGCLATLGRYADSEPHLLNAEALLAPLGDAHRHVVSVRTRLADLYDAWGKPEKAAEWRAKVPKN